MRAGSTDGVNWGVGATGEFGKAPVDDAGSGSPSSRTMTNAAADPATTTSTAITTTTLRTCESYACAVAKP